VRHIKIRWQDACWWNRTGLAPTNRRVFSHRTLSRLHRNLPRMQESTTRYSRGRNLPVRFFQACFGFRVEQTRGTGKFAVPLGEDNCHRRYLPCALPRQLPSGIAVRQLVLGDRDRSPKHLTQIRLLPIYRPMSWILATRLGGRFPAGRAFTRSNPEDRVQVTHNERFGLFASLVPPIDIPAHFRVVTRQLTAAYLGSRARPGKERELSGPGSQVFPRTRELFWSDR
jgi:hypothetical protein